MIPRRVELVELALLLCAVMVFYFVVIPAGILDPDGFVLEEGFPPSFSARLVAVLAALILVGRMVRLVLPVGKSAKPDIADPANDATENIADETQPVKLSPRVWIGVAVSWLFAFGLVPVLGFALASLITLALMLFVLGERKLLHLALLPVLVSAGVWLLFSQILSVKLPTGMLIPLITGS